MDSAPRVLRADYGDGYTQRAGDGINNDPEMWRVIFVNIDDAVGDAIEAFLKARGGHEYFLWTAPGRSQRRYICSRWGFTYSQYSTKGFQAEFEEVFDLT
jgi:phage-related protein